EGLAAQAGERRARVGKRVDANAEPRHSVTAAHSYQTKEEDDQYAEGWIFQQHPEIDQDDDGNEHPEDQQESPLRKQVGFAGFPNQLGDLSHSAMNRQ